MNHGPLTSKLLVLFSQLSASVETPTFIVLSPSAANAMSAWWKHARTAPARKRWVRYKRHARGKL